MWNRWERKSARQFDSDHSIEMYGIILKQERTIKKKQKKNWVNYFGGNVKILQVLKENFVAYEKWPRVKQIALTVVEFFTQWNKCRGKRRGDKGMLI